MARSMHLHLARMYFPFFFTRELTICVLMPMFGPRVPKAFDALIHLTFESSFLWLSTFGRQVNTSAGPFAELCEFLLAYIMGSFAI